jgi:hypothetical protein
MVKLAFGEETITEYKCLIDFSSSKMELMMLSFQNIHP